MVINSIENKKAEEGGQGGGAAVWVITKAP